MVYLGLSFKVSKHSQNDYRTMLLYAKKAKKDKLLKSGGNANSEKTRWPIFRLNLKVPKT